MNLSAMSKLHLTNTIRQLGFKLIQAKKAGNGNLQTRISIQIRAYSAELATR